MLFLIVSLALLSIALFFPTPALSLPRALPISKSGPPKSAEKHEGESRVGTGRDEKGEREKGEREKGEREKTRERRQYAGLHGRADRFLGGRKRGG